MTVAIVETFPEILIQVHADINASGAAFTRDYVRAMTSNGGETGWETAPDGNLPAELADGTATNLSVRSQDDGQGGLVNVIDAQLSNGVPTILTLVQAASSP